MIGSQRWYQIHLSTLVYLVLAAGALLGMNLAGGKYAIDRFTSNQNPNYSYGWPLKCYYRSEHAPPPYRWYWRWENVRINVVFAALMFGAVAVLSERYARGSRRDVRLVSRYGRVLGSAQLKRFDVSSASETDSSS